MTSTTGWPPVSAEDPGAVPATGLPPAVIGAAVDTPDLPAPQAVGAAPPSGPDLARAALAQAKTRAKERGLAPRSGRSRAAALRSGPVGDARDPVRFGAAIARLVTERGWENTTSAARVVAEWDSLVGAEIADHCQPASLLGGELVLVAESSAWATQLRLLAHTLVARLTASVGPGIVTRVVVRGPAQPDWRRGPRRVRGRGPRDTYG